MVWGGLIILSCLFVGRGDAAIQIFYSVGMVWGGLIILSCLFVGRGDAAI
jgi:Na+-transporting NADH:ubiquinone oxidoreductase subunit NqrD